MPERRVGTVEVLRAAVSTRGRRLLLAATLLLGLLTAVAVATTTVATGRTFAGLTAPVQLGMSVGVPCLGVLLGRDVARRPTRARVLPALLAAASVAVAVALIGVLGVVGVLAVLGSHAADPWAGVGAVTWGSVLVQVLALLVGTGIGLLVPSVVLGCLATVALPLGLWALLGTVDALRPAQAWLTPFATTGDLLAGRTAGMGWVRWLVVVLLWGVGLNLVGLLRARPDRRTAAAR